MNTPYFQILLKENRLPTPYWDNETEEFIAPIAILALTRHGAVKIAKGFKWDGMSWLRMIWGRQGWPSAWHDWPYRIQPEGWTQKMADEVFLDLMIEANVPEWRAKVRYRGLRLFGWYAWWRNKKRYAEERKQFAEKGYDAFLENTKRYERNNYETNGKRYGG